MGNLMVRSGGGMSTVAKVTFAVVVCYAALHVLPFILGASFVVGIVGLALVSSVIAVITALLNLALTIGVPVLVILFALSLLKRGD